jgi:SAM-dependent MidA family methyltransferase
VDLAAGDGSFFAGVFEALGGGADAVLGQAVAVERSAPMRRRLSENTAGRALTCVEAISEVQSTENATVIHASELYDAHPVVRVVARDEELRELWVAADRKGLAWSERPARDEVRAYFRDHGVVLEAGQIAEANLSACDSHAAALELAGDRGLMLTLDYGYESARLYDARGRRGGSLATFHRHRVGRDPFASPGEVDLTAHVNGDDLRRPAREREWTEIGLWPLAEFLVRGGLGAELDEMGLGMQAEIDAETFAVRQEIKRLLDPEGMGADLKVLVQAHGQMADIASNLLASSAEF